MIQSNQIKDYLAILADVEVACKIWGKKIAALKGKTIRKKPILVSKDFIKIPRELFQVHKDIFLTADVFFVNKIPFFLTLSCRTCFTAANHLANRTITKTFKVFKQVYQYHMNRGFKITTVHANGEFAPIKPLIEALPYGPQVDLVSSNEHVPEIEHRI